MSGPVPCPACAAGELHAVEDLPVRFKLARTAAGGVRAVRALDTPSQLRRLLADRVVSPWCACPACDWEGVLPARPRPPRRASGPPAAEQWTPPPGISPRDERICRAYLNGCALRQAGAVGGVSAPTASNVLRKWGVRVRPHPHKRKLDHDAILALRRDGVTPARIARRLGLRPSSVRDVLAKAGLTGPPQGWPPAPPPAPRPPRRRPAAPRARASIDVSQLLGLRDEGLTPARIAQRLGSSERTVRRILDERGEPYARARPRRVDFDEDQLRAWAAQRVTATEMAARLGVSDRTVRRALRSLGLR